MTRRLSREFLAHGAPLTPELERMHAMDTARVAQPFDARATTRYESGVARRLHRQHAAAPIVTACVVFAASIVGLCVGALFAALLMR